VGIKIHNIVTGELENTLAGHLLNAANHPDHSAEEVLPFGFTHDHVLHDGTPAAGGMVPIPVWLIEGASKKILIDTGLGDLDELMSMMKTYGVDMFASRDEDQDIVAGLAARGVTPEEIDIVVLTHLHFDHIGNNHLFPNAKFIVQRSEVAQGFTPPKYCQFSYPEYSYNVTNVRDRIQIIEGDMQLVPGVRLIKIGGHTPGTMVVVVDTDEGRVALAGDIMYNYKNLELNWPTGSFWLRSSPPGGGHHHPRSRLGVPRALPQRNYWLSSEGLSGQVTVSSV
jgi:glyoxylase-like metal-dependent hydrolase (beta-lactamase superfamily II)